MRICPSLVAVSLASLLAACGTPSEVRDYAKTSSAQLTTVKSDVAGLLTREEGVISSRRRVAGQLFDAAQDSTESLDQSMLDEQTPSDETCGQACTSLIQSVIDLYTQQQGARDRREQDLQRFLADLDGNLKALAPTTTASVTALDTAAKSASSLGDEMSKAEIAAFLFDYFKEVKKSVDEGKKQKEAAAGSEGQTANENATDSADAQN